MKTGIRRGLRTALAGSLLFGGLTTVSVAAASALTVDTASATTSSCVAVNASLVSGLNDPTAIAVSGSDLFVTEAGSGTVGEYTTSGATVNASLISGLGIGPTGIAVSGSDLFVTDYASDTVGEVHHLWRHRQRLADHRAELSPRHRRLWLGSLCGQRHLGHRGRPPPLAPPSTHRSSPGWIIRPASPSPALASS